MAGRTRSPSPPRPKFPHKGRQRKRRLLLALGLTLLIGAGIAAVLFHQRSSDSTAQNFGNALSPGGYSFNAANATRPAPEAVRSATRAGRETPSRPASPRSSSNATAPAAPQSPQRETAPASPPIAPTGVATPSSQPVVPPSAPGSAAASPATPGSTAPAPQGSASTPSPFAGRTLGEVSALLTRAYAGRTPKEWGEALSGITSRLPGTEEGAAPHRPVLALTLDACGGKAGTSYDAELIAFLRRKKIPATLFVTSIWMRQNPQALKELAADPLFEIAAHGTHHRPASMNGRMVYGIKGTISITDLVYEVEGNARDIEQATGKRPRWFRSGTAYYDEIAVSVIRDLGLSVAGYRIAADQGATLPAAKVTAKTLSAKDGDILLLHMNHPQSGTRAGLLKALPELLERGFTFVRLSDMPGRPGER